MKIVKIANNEDLNQKNFEESSEEDNNSSYGKFQNVIFQEDIPIFVNYSPLTIYFPLIWSDEDYNRVL